MLGLFFSYSIHVGMVKDGCDKYIIGDFKDFLKLFNKNKWSKHESFKNSLFNYFTDSEIHASIYKFGGIGFVFKNFFEYHKAKKYLKKN